MTKNIKAQAGTLVYKQFIKLDDNTEVQVRYNQDPALYAGTDTPLYAYTAKEGKGTEAKEVTRYAVPVEFAKRATRASVKDSVANMLADGLTAEEIVARLQSK